MSQFDSFISADARNFRPSAIRALSRFLNAPGTISFAGGAPNPQTFPSEQFAAIAQKVILEKRDVALQYGPTLGIPRLRSSIAEIMRGRSVECTASDAMVTTGSQQGLNLVSHVLIDPDDVVLVELPTFVGATSAFYGRRAQLEGVAQDDDGIVPESVEETVTRVRAEGRRVKFLYTIPNFQNPSGRLMTKERRQRLVELANRLDFIILEDDPYGELVYVEGAYTTPLKAIDTEGRVVYMGSFSKILSPGLRCAFIVAERNLLKGFETAKECADLCTGMLDQSIVDEYCAQGLLPAQITKVRAFYRDRRQTLLSLLEQYLSAYATWTEAQGGIFTFVTMNNQALDTAPLVQPAVEQGVAFVPGSQFYVNGGGRNTMRLTFAKEPDDRMREGMPVLARVLIEAGA